MHSFRNLRLHRAAFHAMTCLLFGLVMPAAAQNISGTITAANVPTGTATAPHFVIDSDASNPDPLYNRNTIPASVDVEFNWTGGFTSDDDTFRAAVQLIDPDENVITLSSGETSVSQLISLSWTDTSTTRTFHLNPDPAVDLGAGVEYRLRYTIQKRVVDYYDIFGDPVYDWADVDGPDDSSPFTVIHFADEPADPQARYARGYLRADPTWQKLHALQTATTTANRSFQVSVPYTHSRYDVNGATESVNLRFIVEMQDDLGNAVPLENGGIDSVEYDRAPFIAGAPNTPFLINANRAVNFRPTVQLDARNRTYQVRVRFEHLEIPAADTYRDNGTSGDTSLQRLLHFNGNLRFGPVSGGLPTIVNSYSNAPIPGTLGTDLVNTTLSVNSGTIPGFPDYTFGNGSPLNVQLLSNGDSIVTLGSQPVIVSGGGDVSADFGGITVVYPDTTLTPSGPHAFTAVVQLPQGLSYTPDRATSGGRYFSEISVPGSYPLAEQLRHSGTLILPLPANAWVFDESRPLLYQVSDFLFDTPVNEIQFTASDAEWAHQQAFDQLETQESSGQHEHPTMATRYSNDGYLRFVSILTGDPIRFASAADGTNRCTYAALETTSGQFTTHFPLGTQVEWNLPGSITISGGLITPGSYLTGTGNLTVEYDGSCPDDDCRPGGGAVDQMEITPSGATLYITADGGLQAPGTIAPTQLKWGIRGDSTFTHRTDEFLAATFLAGGNQLYNELNPTATSGPQQNVAGDLGPGVITLAGFDPTNPGSPIYSESAGYLDGTGVWPGATVTVENSGHQGASRIADRLSEFQYTLMQEASKYYVRPSGVSGRHVAMDNSYDPDMVLYGYLFELTSYQMAFLSNDSKEPSWIHGSLSVPHPSNFSLAFRELDLSCIGALGDTRIDPNDAGPKNLEYWSGSFTPISMRFAPTVEASCYDPRVLTIGLITGAANVPSPLAGTLAFKNDGNIGTLEDEIEGVDGRLGLPATIPLDGPGNEIYALNPVTKLYFNNYTTTGKPPNGFVSFAATCSVPYFEDLRVHVMTSAKADVPSAVYLASNWKDGANQSHFTNTRFDQFHRGFPDGIAAGQYQNPTTVTFDVKDYRVRATQSIFGIVPLDYPLRWNSGARFFESWESVENELLVLEVEHQIDYLSAENAEISFGAKYDGLPKISLASAATGIIDDQLGASRALTNAARSFVTDSLNQGVDEIGNLINDNMESLLELAIDEIKAEVIDKLYGAIGDSYEDAVADNDKTYDDWLNQGSGELKSVFDAYLDGTFGDPANSIKSRLQQLSAASDDASSLIQRVTDAVDSGILAIDAIAGSIELVNGEVVFNDILPSGPFIPHGQSALDGIIPGLLAKIPGPDGPERQLVQNLVLALISELAPPAIAASLTSGINAQLNELLDKFDPTLDRITEVLLESRKYLVTVREQLDQGGDIFNSFETIITNAEAEIDNMMTGIRTRAYAFIDQMVAHAALPRDTPLGQIGSVLDEFNEEEFVALIRTELRDRLLATKFIRSIQYQLRQTISEFDIALRSAIDSAFAEVNRMCRELIKEALGPIDDKINGLLGDINDVFGAGSLDGYAHIQGDTLRRIRIDAMVELKVPDDLKLQAYFEMLCYDSGTDTGSSSCIVPGSEVVEVRIGAIDAPLDWISPNMRGDLDFWFAMQTDSGIQPKGIGGRFKMTDGVLDFQSFKITEFGAGVAFGSSEAYIAAATTVLISDYEASGGIFFGKTCSLAPLEMVDPDVSQVLGFPPFTGAYVYGEVWLPISETLLGIPSSCFFRISAGVGAGAFYFIEGPTYGGKILLGVSGEALCLVSITGSVTMVGVMSNGELTFTGNGKLKGKAGSCPFCLKFNKSAKLKYQSGKWSVDL